MKKSLCYSLLLSFVISVLTAFSSYASTETEPKDPIAETLYLLNLHRELNGLTRLTLDSKIIPVSDIRVLESASLFSHTRPDGRRYSTAFSDAKVCYRYCGEILAFGYQTPEQVITAWMASPGHRNAILSQNYTKAGISHFIANNGQSYWAVEFISD